MGYEDDKVALETRLSTTTGLPSGIVIKYANADIPDPEEADFLACEISYGKAEEASLGGEAGTTSPLRRYTGAFVVQIFIKEPQGSGSAARLADKIADRFRGQAISSGSQKLRCYTPLVQPVGPDGKGHYQYTVAIPFKRDQQH